MLYSFFSSAKRSLVSYALFAVLLISQRSLAFSQNQIMTPSSAGGGDTVMIDFFPASGIAGPEMEVAFAYNGKGYLINPASDITIITTNSPFAEGTTLSTSFEIDNDNHILTVTLTRLDGESIYLSGTSSVCRGVGILLGEVNVRSAMAESGVLKVFPNPASAYTQVDLPGTGTAQIQIRNTMGQIVWQQTYDQDKGAVKIPLSALAAGAYVISVQQNDRKYQTRLLVS